MSIRYTEEDYVSPEYREKHLKSIKDAEGLKERPLLCPHCGYKNGISFSDLRFGHMVLPCRKCKLLFTVDFAAFRREPYFNKVIYSDIPA